MKKLFGFILLAAMLAGGWWTWRFFSPTPRQQVEKRLNQVARLASFAPNEGNITRVAKIERLGRFFTDDVQVLVNISNLGTHTFTGRDELMQFALAAKQLGNGLKAEFLDMNVEMGVGNLSALVDLTLRGKVNGENDVIDQELKFTLKKVDSDWLISRVETVSTLKP